MKIFYCAFIRIPTEKAHGAQIMKTCEAFASEGSTVDLMVPNRKTHITEDSFEYYGVKKNFSICKLPVLDLVELGNIGFLLSMLWFSEVAKWQKSFSEADVIYSRDAFVLLQYILLNRKMVYEAHTRPTLISLFVAKHVDKLVVISEGLRDAYIEKGVTSEKIVIAHDAIDPEPFKVEHSQKNSREWLSIPQDKRMALYVGKIDEAKGADIFAEASNHAPENILCVLVGPESLQKKKWKEKYPKALFLSETPYRELPRVLAAADVLVLPNSAKNENASKYTSPLKAFAYMATGKPIVASDVPAIRSILKDGATFFAADDPLALVEAIRASDKGSEPSFEHSWQNRARIILDFV